MRSLGATAYFPHQEEAIEWMLRRERTRIRVDDYVIRGGILADEMGLGKTFEVLGLIANGVAHSTLILTPLAVLDTWIRTASKTGMFNIYTVSGKAGSYEWSLHSFAEKCAPTIYICNMEKIIRNHSLCFTKKGGIMDRLVVDEAHKLRNCMSSTYRTICTIPANCRWAVTATPIVNSFKDAAAIIHYIAAGESYLPNRIPWTDAMEAVLPHIVLRRTVAELRAKLSFLPAEPTEETLQLPFTTPAEENFYNAVQGIMKDDMIDKYMNYAVGSVSKLSLLLRLRQISVHPQVYISSKGGEPWDGPSTKFEAITNILRNEASNDYLIFCSFKEEIKLLRRYLRAADCCGSIVSYHGEMSAEARNRALLKAEAAVGGTKPSVVICQINCGGVGLNLQYLNRVIFLSPWWTSATMEQAIGRVIRIGQSRPVKITYLRLKAEDESALSIDTIMYDSVTKKKRIAEQFFNAAFATD
jgi:SNF2 family DNA or RNA helicase